MYETRQVHKTFSNENDDHTKFDTDVFPIFRRRNTDIEVTKNGAKLDNTSVFTYNRNLFVQFDADINVEACIYSKSVKYLSCMFIKGPIEQ